MTTPSIPLEPDRARLLDAAERLFYGRGIQAVGMDQVRAASNLPLKRMYQLYPGKQDLVVAFLHRRHERMMAAITESVYRVEGPQQRVLALFDWLHAWFQEPDFRGCAWINAFGELGPTSTAVSSEVHNHQRDLRELMTGVATGAGCSAPVAAAVYLLAEGAVVAAALQHSPAPAMEAREAVRLLLAADVR